VTVPTPGDLPGVSVDPNRNFPAIRPFKKAVDLSIPCMVIVVNEQMFSLRYWKSQEIVPNDRGKASMRIGGIMEPVEPGRPHGKCADHRPDHPLLKGDGDRGKRNIRIEQGDLTTHRDHFTTCLQKRTSCKWFEVGDDQVRLELLNDLSEFLQPAKRLRESPTPIPDGLKVVRLPLTKHVGESREMAMPSKLINGRRLRPRADHANLVPPCFQHRNKCRCLGEMPLALSIATVNDAHGCGLLVDSAGSVALETTGTRSSN
jgi:hypothetical protein